MMKPLTFALALLACLCASAPAQTINLAAVWRVDSTNTGGNFVNCSLILSNSGATTLTNKIYEFDFDPAYQVTTSPPQSLASQAGSHYRLTNLSYFKGVLLPGDTNRIGLKVAPIIVNAAMPTNIFVNGLPLVGFYVPPVLAVADVTVTEGNSGLTPMNFQFTLSRAVSNAASFNYTAVSGTATAGVDFLPASGVVTFSPGQTQQVVTVSVVGDRKPEYDEAFTLALSNPINCAPTRTNLAGTILDEDRMPLTWYSAWRASNNLPVLTGNDTNADASGQAIFNNYFLGQNPQQTNTGASQMKLARTNGQLQMTYPAWRPDIAYRVQTSDTLGAWTTNGVSEMNDGQLHIASVAAPPGVATRFLKLRTDWLPNTTHFLELYDAIHNPTNGYFNAQGIPYHTPETLLCEAPDYGHETTSEAYSYYILLEAMYGRISGDWSRLNTAWNNLETYMIPSHADQPSNDGMNITKAATYAPEWELPSQYPAVLNTGAVTGADPLYTELKTTYGSSDIYGMHWLMDVDNWYGFGQRGDGTSHPSFINTFQRGPQESVWETVPQPSWDIFNTGGTHGYLDLFTGDSSYTRQWRYTDAPDADARAIQAVFWAKKWADAQGGSATVNALAAKASRMGDTLRYALFDKYFRNVTNNTVAGTGRQAAHYLLSWYYAWGGSTNSNNGWAWRIGSSHSHFGYQNPMAAWALGNDATFIPQSPTARQDWTNSARRQLEFYRWLQADEGGIAGGATCSWNGRYETPPAGTPKFYGLAYTEQPVYIDPPSNEWFGFQTWSMQRVAELYYLTNDPLAKSVLDKWVTWVLANLALTNNSYAIPATLAWSGQPDNWIPAAPGANSGLHVTVTAWNQDVGIGSSVARTLLYYAAGTKRWATENVAARTTAKTLLDRIWANGRDDKGVSVPENRADYSRFFEQTVYTPSAFLGHMPNGDTITNGVKFLGLRSKYQQDPAFPALATAYTNWVAGGRVGSFQSPTYRYHRFWAQVDAALANAEYDLLFPQ